MSYREGMDSQTDRTSGQTLELAVDAGCPQCRGPLQVRVTPRGSRAVCVPCQLILNVVLRPDPSTGLGIAFPVMAQA
jgi:hypothetical protein